VVKKALSNNPIIPGEQLEGWSSWLPAELSPSPSGFSESQLAGLDALRRHLEGAPTAAAAEAAEALAAAQQLAVPLAEEEAAPPEEGAAYPTASELEAIHQEAWQAGYDEGIEAGRAAGLEQGLLQGREQAVAQFAELWTPLQQLSANFARELQRVEEELSGSLLALAMQLAEKLVAEHIASQDSVIVSLLSQVLHELPASMGQARLRVHPADLAAARQFLEQETPETQWQWIEDPQMQRGGCMIDTAALRLDLRLASRLTELAQALGMNSRHDDLAD